MKRKTTREILAESFRELARDRNVDKITIQDIVNNCGYSTATFYRHFKDKYDLIAWEYACVTAKIMGRIDDSGYSWRRTLKDGAEHFFDERDYIVNLIRHTTGHDSFVRYMTEINFSTLKEYILRMSGKGELSAMDEMYVRIYCLGTVSLTCEWLIGKYDATPQEIAAVYENSLPQPLRTYLL